jgi:hypothetical protein
MKRDVMPAAVDLSVDVFFLYKKGSQANVDERKQLLKKERSGCGEKMPRAI